MAIKLYYEEVLDEKPRSPSKLQALTNKVMDKVRKDHTFAFTKHLPIYNPSLGPKFLKQIQVHYDMNLETKMLTKKL
jgi:hypothetical protein